jgi:hypothetical protein
MQPTENPYASPQATEDAVPEREKQASNRRALRAIAAILFTIACGEIGFGLIATIDSLTQMFIVAFWYGDSPFQISDLPPQRLALAMVTFLRGSITTIGTWKMRLLRNYRWSLAAVISSLLGILHPYTWISVPFGLWALVILLQKETRAAFAESK